MFESIFNACISNVSDILIFNYIGNEYDFLNLANILKLKSHNRIGLVFLHKTVVVPLKYIWS